MKTKILFVYILFCFSYPQIGFSQQSTESLIRKLEDKERQAILKGDTMALSHLMSKKIIVQNPENTIVGFHQIMERIKTGKINYASFERKIDTVAFVNGLAIVMGIETLVPKTGNVNASTPIKRRFSNVWTKERNVWKLTARQATIVLVKQN